MTQKKQVLCGLRVLFLIFNCQTPGYLETGNVPDMEQMKKSGHAAIFWLKVMGREFASFQGIVHIWGRDYPYRSGFELIILLKDIVGFTERRGTRRNWMAARIC